MSSLQTPVAAMTLRARTVNDVPSVRSDARTPTTGAMSPPPTPPEALAVPDQPGHPGAGEHPRAVAGGGADDGQRVPGVVDLGVPVPDRAPDDVAAQPRERRERGRAGQVPVPRDLALAGEGGAEDVVERDARAVVGALPHRRGERQQERQRARPGAARWSAPAATAPPAPRAPAGRRTAPGSAGRRGSACSTGWRCRPRSRAPRAAPPTARGWPRPGRRRRR